MKFFRKIRSRLLKKGKISGYLLYATGEIILVVIGILIALGVNNYTEKQKAKAQSRVFLTDMLEDLAADTSYLNKMMPVLKEQMAYEDWLAGKTDLNIDVTDSITRAISNVNWSFHITERAFLNLQNSQGKKLIGYEELYSPISKYYITVRERIVENNQLEKERSSIQGTFEQVVRENAAISVMEYSNYDALSLGVKMKMNRVDNFNKIKEHFSSIQAFNEINERNIRNQFLYMELILTRLNAINLIESIYAALETPVTEES